MKNNILMIAGEPSGDARAGEMLKALKPLLPGVSFWGVGGGAMEREGVELVEHIRNLSIMGIWEAVKNLGKIRAQFARIARETDERRPSLAILVDYPGFNLKVAHFLKKKNIPVIYYVVPQVWAWGEWRIKNLKADVSKCLTLFSFEEKFLKDRGVEAEFVGNPLLDSAPEAVAAPHERFTVALLPGSRKSEIKKMLPLMLRSAEIIKGSRPDVDFIMAESSNVPAEMYDAGFALHPSINVKRLKDDTYGALMLSDFAMVTSGTATLETAVMEKPMVVTYKVTLLTEALFKAVSKLRLVSLVNIIAGLKEIVPEFVMRHKVFPEKIAAETLRIINDPARMEKMRADLREVKKALGPKGASRRAAEAIARFIREKDLLNELISS